MRTLLILLGNLYLLNMVLSYKILCIYPVPSRSHNLLAKGIVDALLKAGHEVTWATPYPDLKPIKNLKIIDMSITVPLAENINMIEKGEEDDFSLDFPINITILTANNPELRHEVVHTQYDAVITEWFLSDTDAGYAAVQQVPWIVLSGMVMNPYIENMIDEVRSVSTVPVMMMNNYPIPMNFWQRIMNTFSFGMLMYMLMGVPTAERYEEFFAPLAAARGVPLPPFESARYNISILFVNSHPSIAPALTLPPNVVNIAGYHISEEVAPLPKDIQDLMDSSPQGVVYFSMGSVVHGTMIPEKTREDLIRMLGNIPYTVLWKFEEDLKGLPKNIHISKWWPQPSILAHPNTKLFITHGGQLSSLEAVRYGLPVLMVPVFGDQHSNSERAANQGYARKVPFSRNMVEELTEVLNDMLSNDSYRKQAQHLSKLFNKRPVPPQKLISHYVELAIETKGAYHLRSKTHLYPWYQRWMLDQLAALLALIFILRIALKAFIRRFRKETTKENKTKQKVQ